MMYCATCGTRLEEHWIVCPNCGVSIKKIIEPKQLVTIPQQEIVIPHIPHQTIKEKDLKIKWKKIVVLIFLAVVIFLCGGTLGNMSINPFNNAGY